MLFLVLVFFSHLHFTGLGENSPSRPPFIEELPLYIHVKPLRERGRHRCLVPLFRSHHGRASLLVAKAQSGRVFSPTALTAQDRSSDSNAMRGCFWEGGVTGGDTVMSEKQVSRCHTHSGDTSSTMCVSQWLTCFWRVSRAGWQTQAPPFLPLPLPTGT